MITLIKNATTTGTSSSYSTIYGQDTGHSDHTFQVVHTGSPTAVTINIEASIDGTNYICIASHALNSNELASGTSIFHITNKPVSKIRVNIYRLDGGVSPTVSVYYLKGQSSVA